MSGTYRPESLFGKASLDRRTLVGGAAAGAAALHAPGILQHTVAQDATPMVVDPGTPPVEIFESLQQYPLTTEGKTFRIVITDESPDRVDNYLTDWMQELTGVTIEWIVVPADGAIEQMNLQLAGGDLPDAYMGFLWTPITPTQLSVYGEQGLFLDLKDMIAENALNLNELSVGVPEALKIVTAPSGAIYSMPQINQCYHCSMPQKMWVNQVWLDNLGLSIPTTPDEFKAMLQAFKDGDPNGNGEADEIPMTVSATTNLGDLDAFLMNPFQFSPGEPWMYVDGGTVVSSYTQDGWREGVKYMRDLYANGLLDNESFTQSWDDLYVKTRTAETPIVGAGPTFWKAALWDFNGPYFKEYVAIPQLTGPTGLQQTLRSYSPGSVGGLMITNKCEDPALLMRWADTLYATEATLRVARGEPGMNWRWATEGEVGINEEQAIWAIITQAPGAFDNARATNWSELCPMWFSLDLRHGQAVVVDRNDETETILYDATLNMQEPWGISQEQWLPPLFFTSEQANVVALNGVGVIDLVKSQYTAWVTGQGDPDADWDTYLDQLRSIGYDQLLATYQQAYDESSWSS